ncbi:MAG TPA: tyrosine-type recombinase/integrase [Candidatus Blautia faecavium]|uniref:Tyrosine-type recombinase/integrase n=1 Tax=Candidatus Blautia faecavium TaxID=2838487 RepID=A0A9D2LRV4_9FIRM|nr:tyrosine-type recombinase/integrase [Candidatus Blautia faecavium]
MDDYLKQFREMISLRGLTDHTIVSYSTYIRVYLDYLSYILHKMPEDVSWAELRGFVRWLQKEKNLSDRTINHCISQLRFFTLYVLHKPWDASQLPMRRFDSYLPYVPSQKETWAFIHSFSNLKHKAILSLMYSAGLRVGEVCALRYEDISRSSMRIHIRHSKARSDRYAILSRNALDILTQYWFHAGRPTGFLFPSRNDPARPMASYTVNQFIFAKEKELGLKHQLTCHSFRHAFGTHLYENGADLLTIKALLGHKSLNSTTIYVHLASNGIRNAVSPFDRMGGGSLG